MRSAKICNWNRSMQLLPLCAACSLGLGCDSLSGLIGFLGPTVVTVELVNNSDFAVEGELFYDDEDDTIEELLEENGTRRQFVLPAGDRSSFSVNCDDLRAIIISDADLQLIGEIGPSASTDVLRDGNDFDCGDRIVFTFDHSSAIVDFDVTTSVQGGQ